MTDTPWAPGPAGTPLHALPSPGPVSRPPGLPAQSQGLELGPSADLTPQGAAELAVAAETGGGQAHELSRRLARSLSPEARRILLNALTETAPDDGFTDDGKDAGDGDLYDAGRYEDDGDRAYDDEDDEIGLGLGLGLGLGDEEGGGDAYGVGVCDGGDGLLGGVPGAAAVRRAGLSLVPGRPEHGPGRVSGRAGSGRGAPPGMVRLRFADEAALERAGAAFGAGPGGGAFSDPETLTLQIPGEAGTESLRAVLDVLDAAAITAESLTVHSHELDDVFSALTGPVMKPEQ
ncbi:hypothetical protein [Streptomyces sp. NPDC005345]|uniref:hypothetical protein n=1 Tax=Streptomyces sp. NPDC005345 TaxID=3156877 RepID=UPI0033B33B0F